PRCPANSRNTGPKHFRILPYNAFFRPCGIHTTWYLPSHFEWRRLSYDDVVMQYAPCGAPSPSCAYDNIIFYYIFRPSLESLPGQTRGLPVKELTRLGDYSCPIQLISVPQPIERSSRLLVSLTPRLNGSRLECARYSVSMK